MYDCFECWRAEMKFKGAFFQVLEIFLTYFFTRDKYQDIFNEFFRPSIVRVKNVETFVKCQGIVEKIETSTLLKFHWSKSTFKTDVQR